MFKSLRTGVPLYVLTKGDEPCLEICEVLSRTEPMQQFGATTNVIGGQQYFNPPQFTVDVKVRKPNGEEVNYQKIPADIEIVDFGSQGVVLSTSSNAIQNEIETLRKHSLRVLDSIDQHKKTVALCDKYLSDLNPQIKQDAERSKEIETLRGEMNELRGDMIDIKGMLAKALNSRKTKED